MKMVSRPAALLAAAVVIASCVSLQSSTAALPFYMPSSDLKMTWAGRPVVREMAVNRAEEFIDLAKLRVAAALPKWRLEGGGVVAAAIIEAGRIVVVDAAGQRTVIPMDPAPGVLDVKVTYTSPTAPTLHIGEHALVPTSRLDPRDVRLLADAINTVRVSAN